MAEYLEDVGGSLGVYEHTHEMLEGEYVKVGMLKIVLLRIKRLGQHE